MPIPKSGDTAPAVILKTDSGEDFNLAQLKGSWVVLFFYPKASTSGCTVEARQFRDLYAKFQKQKATVIGISPDTPASQTKFKEKENLPFTLLCDVDHHVADAYGVWQEKSLYGRRYFGVARTTFIIDPKGKIKKVFEKVKPDGHAAQVVSAL